MDGLNIFEMGVECQYLPLWVGVENFCFINEFSYQERIRLADRDSRWVLSVRVFSKIFCRWFLKTVSVTEQLIHNIMLCLKFLNLNFELYFYLNTVNLSDKIIIIKITVNFTLYKHDLKISIVKIEKILLYIDAVCVLSIQTKKSRQPFRKD